MLTVLWLLVLFGVPPLIIYLDKRISGLERRVTALQALVDGEKR